MTKMTTANQIIKTLKKLSVPKNKEGMSRYGIDTRYALGVSIPNLRKIAKEIGRNHELASELWKTKTHEARILASMIDNPAQVTENQLESWVKNFNSWDLCDQCCMNLFDKTKFAYKKAVQWSKREEEYVKRAGFALMACLAWHDKDAPNKKFVEFMPCIINQSIDNRNYVKKAVNWALRQIGKKNTELNKVAIQTAKKIQKIDSKTAKWIAADALRELQSEKVQKRLR